MDNRDSACFDYDFSERDQDTCECGSRDIVGGDARRVYCARCYEVNFGGQHDDGTEDE